MRRGSPAGAVLVLAALCLVPQGRGSAAPSTATSTAPLIVRLINLRSSNGYVGCTLFRGPRGFPIQTEDGIERLWCPITQDVSICRFGPIPPGTYAISCFHDENGNHRLDQGFLGIPKEGWVVSNEARAHLAPPAYNQAKFEFHGVPTELTLHMGYRSL